MRMFIWLAVGLGTILLGKNAWAQEKVQNPVGNEITGEVYSRQWKDIYENRPASVETEGLPHPQAHPQEQLKALKDQEKKVANPLWGDGRARREARKARTEVYKEKEQALEEGKPVDPKLKTPVILPNNQMRRQARAQKEELRKKEEELKAQGAVYLTNTQKTNSMTKP